MMLNQLQFITKDQASSSVQSCSPLVKKTITIANL